MFQVLDAELHRAGVDDPESPPVSARGHVDFAGFYFGKLLAVSLGIRTNP